MSRNQSLVVVPQNPEKPVPKEVLADAIVSISKAMRELSEKSRLNRDAIITLVSHTTRSSGLARSTIATVLDAISQLEHDYVA